MIELQERHIDQEIVIKGTVEREGGVQDRRVRRIRESGGDKM
jgi:hypothetical protein